MPEGELEGTGEPEEPQKEIAVLETSHGVIEIELYRESAPITVENFVGYVNSGFYEGTIFHRNIPGFMVQGGGFTEDGTEKETNPPIVLESDNGLSNERGTVAMARTMVADSATSQFFINTVDNPALDYGMGTEGYAVFGKVISGMDEAVIAIETTPTTSRAMHDNWPVENIVIQKAYMKN
ncbi:TPA: peptidyl-prolyl cis-trans isomerase [Candidatus Micrarchaeota archaeon]|nr:peptidyl-prolyl cis-trans isomerase [Candidatus Micrarchaeota archaeon]